MCIDYVPQHLLPSRRQLELAWGYRRLGATATLRLFIPLLLLTWSAVAPTVVRADITYQIVDGSIGASGSVSGTITTDGNTGTNLPVSDITSWDITVTDGSDVLATFTPANSLPYGSFSATDQAITITPNHSLEFEFNTTYVPFVDFYIAGTSQYWYGYGESPYFSVSGSYPEVGSAIATASVPEPSTATLAVFGAVGVGVCGWLRRRRATGRRSAA